MDASTEKVTPLSPLPPPPTPPNFQGFLDGLLVTYVYPKVKKSDECPLLACK